MVLNSNSNYEKNQPITVTLEIENKSCKGMAFVKSKGIKDCRLIDVRNMENGLTRHLIEIDTKSNESLEKKSSNFFKVFKKTKKENKSIAWFDSEGCVVCRSFLANSSFLISAKKLDGFKILYSFVSPNALFLKNILNSLDKAKIPVRIIEITRFNKKGNFSSKQEFALLIAYKMGYFEYPRKITLNNLAKKIQISPSNLSELLRKALERVVKQHYGF